MRPDEPNGGAAAAMQRSCRDVGQQTLVAAWAGVGRQEMHSMTPTMLVQVTDISLEDYIAVKPKFAVYVPHTAGRYQKKRFRKAQCPIVER